MRTAPRTRRAAADAQAVEVYGLHASARGRPRAASTKQLSARYSPEVLVYFKSTGEGWQSRMDSVLRAYVSRHSRRA
ncbi:MAG: BrnA antitoxin family protein [Burkholderiaceae bacterium]|nr:BrnA antitoxin family protein [Burkholderiaceae bacterium]